MTQRLSYEERLEIALRLYEALQSHYPDRLIAVSDTRALKLAEDPGALIRASDDELE
jgi:hypothetical protein